MKKYKARLSRRWNCDAKITEVEVERETDASVWIDGRRSKKESEYETYFDSFEQAKTALLDRQQSRIYGLRAQLDNAAIVLNEIAALSRGD
jgi:hypothetical protein